MDSSSLKLIKDVLIYDVYKGNKIPIGKKSIAIKVLIQPIHETLTDKDLENEAKNLGTTIFHPIGTCAMGKVDGQGVAEDLMTVLDSECRLRGVSKLRVIDASAMPSIPSGNTNAPVMLIAETIAKKILRSN